MGTIRRYNRKVVTAPVSAPKRREECATDHVSDTQRHHGLHQQGSDKEDDANDGKHVGEGDVGQHNFQQPIE